jgi:hypothetical protein
MELIIVLIILAIISAAVIPSVVGFVWHGQQINRMNIARTLYVSMQNQLTRNLLEGNLREVLTSHFYVTDIDGNLIIDENTGYFRLNPTIRTVAQQLEANGAEYPERDDINRDFVFPVSIPRDYLNLPDEEKTALQDNFYELLNEVIINKDLLSNTFLMEFNIRTGVVLSIFFGDNIGRGQQVEFEYNTNDNDNTNITGSRGMGAAGYEWDYQRAQGYYGVDWTGEPLQMQLPDLIDIYDGKNTGRLLEGRANVLYAELFIPINTDSLEFRLDLLSDRSRTSVLNSYLNSPYPTAPTGFDVNLTAALNLAEAGIGNLNDALFDFADIELDPDLGGHLIYYPTNQTFTIDSFGINVGALYNKFIWVLDCVYGNLFYTYYDHGIHKYINTTEADPQFIRAGLTRTSGLFEGLETISLTTDHSHYGGELSGGFLSTRNRYTVSSARHLSNIREFPNAEFRQTEDIDFFEDEFTGLGVEVPGVVTNFKPINSFGGEYNSVAAAGGILRPRILNLVIDINVVNYFDPLIDPVNIGLFGDVTGTGEINGISIYEARITAAGARNANTGAIAGSNAGIIRYSYSYANILRQSTPGSNTGGLVGFNAAGGVIDQSFNAGFFDTNRRDAGGEYITSSDANNVFGSVRAGSGNVGGLVGSNSGAISSSYNNARVNIDDIMDMVLPPDTPFDHPFRLSRGPIPTATTGVTNIGGIAGQNNASGTIRRVYATNFIGDGTTAGGIAGINSGNATSIENAFYLRNGVVNDIGETQHKHDLWSQSGLLGAPFTRTPFEAGIAELYMYYPGYNSYPEYPYPVLINNKPFTGTTGQWGWEDIDDIPEGPLVLVYYELYADGTYGFGPTITYLPGVSRASLRNDIPVREAGYMMIVELPEAPVGLTFNIQDENSGAWESIPFNLTSLTPEQTGLTGDFYYAVIDLHELVFVHATGSNINNPATFAAAYGSMPATTPEITGRVHPFYANALDGSSSSFEIRTPWQFENINKSVSGDLGGLEIIPGMSFAEYGGNADGATPPGMTATSTHGTVAQRVQRVQDEAQAPGASSPTIPAGATVIGLGGGRISVGGVESSVERLNVTAANVTLSENFTGITSINVTGANPTFVNITAANCSIYTASATTVNVTQGMHMSNVQLASRGTITVSGTPGSNNVFLDAIFYTTGTTSVNITGATSWSRVAIPQFISQGASTVTMTSPGPNGYISGIFFTNATGGNSIRIDNISIATFHGIFLTTGNINPQGWAIDNANVIVPDSLDPHIRDFLLNNNGWRERPGTKPPDRSLIFRQTRDISFADASSFAQDPSGDIGVPQRYGSDGTTALIQQDPSINAVVTVGFNAVYRGLNNTVRDLTINTATDYSGLFASNDGGLIENLTLESSEIRGNYFVGGIAGDNKVGGLSGDSEGTITGCTVTYLTLNGIAGVGGITGANGGTIELCIVDNTDVLGRTSNLSTNIGGIAGANYGDVIRCGVQYSTVISSNTLTDTSGYSLVGGIVGANADTGVVRDVYFLSVNDLDDIPVSQNGGGIAGQNEGSVFHAFYIAPAPYTTAGSGMAAVKTIYPIVRVGLADTLPDPAPGSTRIIQTCFYLSGTRYFLYGGVNNPDTDLHLWENELYNRITERPPAVILSGGGNGMVTSFLYREWLDFAYRANLTEWFQPTVAYPYPVITGLEIPLLWPIADSAPRPDQLDRPQDGPDWADQIFASDSAGSVGFINGDFEDGINVNNPWNSGGVAGAPWDFFITVNSGVMPGWRTRLVNPSPVGNPNYGTRHNIELLFNNIGARGTPVTAGSGDGRGYFRGSPAYDGPPNWSYGYQAGDSFGLTRTNYSGTQTGVYAELNATTQNTLFQIAPTEPESTVIYSFYHATRHDYNSMNYFGGAIPPPGRETRRFNNEPDLLNFYLSGVINDGNRIDEFGYMNPFVDYDAAGQSFIRPCATPRGQDTNPNSNQDNTERWTRFPVAYGLYSSFYNSLTGQFIGPGYLYDVWIAPDGTTSNDNGYGVTFWSSSPIPVTGVSYGTDGRLLNMAASLSEADAITSQLRAYYLANADNVIGYWDAVRFPSSNPYAPGLISQWKQFYGEYTVPAGQMRTEFAYQSMTDNPAEGNLLDGVSFRSPSFLSIDKFIRVGHNAAPTAPTAMFVKPTDQLTVELNVVSRGEVPANNIVITDILDPFDEYIAYAGNTRIFRGATEITGMAGLTVTAPVPANNNVFTVEFPPGYSLGLDETIRVVFNITVRGFIESDPLNEVTTLLYYFRNQGVVSYNNADYAAYTGMQNGSNIALVYIDPLELDKTVTPPADGNPFIVTLTIDNTMTDSSIDTIGLITDVIPPGFTVNPLTISVPAGVSYRAITTPNGPTTLAFEYVNLSPSVTDLTITYEITYTGRGYGVTFIHNYSRYMYLYSDGIEEPINVLMDFPQPAVGVSIKTTPDTYTVGGSFMSLLDITANDLFDGGGVADSFRMADDNYDVRPEVVLINSDGSLAGTNLDGNYQITTGSFTATLLSGLNSLQFTPNPGFEGEATVLYQIRLTATRPGMPPLVLDSPVTTVTIYVVDSDNLVYFEEYDDGSYGFFSESIVDLNEHLPIVDAGYGVLSTVSGTMRLFLAGVQHDITPIELPTGLYLYIIPSTPSLTLDLQNVTFGSADGPWAPLGSIHPSFAKAVYTYDTPSITAPDTIFIRTEQQWENLNAMLPGYPDIMTDFTIDDSRYIVALLAIFAAPSDFELDLEIEDDEDIAIDNEFEPDRDEAGEEEPCVDDELMNDIENPDGETDFDDTDDTEEENDIENDNNIVNDELYTSDEENDTDSSGANGTDDLDLILAINVVTLFGGYGFTKTKMFKNYIKKSNARAVRKINEHNKTRRR